MMIASPLRLLLAEDSESDAEILLRLLRREGFDVAVERVQTRAGMEAALERGGWDLVIADHTMPAFGAEAALALLRQRQVDLPLIIVSGTISDEAAVACMKQGAADYLLKDRLGRLGEAVRRALDEHRLRAEQRRAAEALRASEASFRLLFAANPLPMWVYDRQTLRFLEVNDAAVAHYGYSREEFLALGIADIRPDEDVPCLLEEVRRPPLPLRGGDQWRHRLKDGRQIEVEIAAHALPFGGREAVLVAATDITERKRAGRALERAKEAAEALARERQEQAEEAAALAQVGAALASALDPSQLYRLVLELTARLVPCETACVLLLEDGWAMVAASWGVPNPPVGTRAFPVTAEVRRRWPAAGGPPLYRPDMRLVEGHRPQEPWVGGHEVRSIITVPLTLDGELVGVFDMASTRPHRYSARQVRLAGTFGERVNQALRNARLYAAEQAARARAEEARAAAQRLASAQGDFVASVSHELRTPLTAIVGFGELLQARWGQFSEARRLERIGQMVQAAARQQRLVEDLLLISRLERDSLSVECAALPLAPLLQEAVATVQGRYPGQRVASRGPAGVRVRADAARLVQVLANLLDNAAKYSPQGSPIAVGWGCAGGTVAVRVRDCGPGISPEEREVLFTRFGRVPGSRMRAGYVGTGLGLYLSRELARAMGGELDLEGTGPRGSTFRLRLPAADSAGPGAGEGTGIANRVPIARA